MSSDRHQVEVGTIVWQLVQKERKNEASHDKSIINQQ